MVGSMTVGLIGAGLRNEEAVRDVVGESALSSVVMSSSMAVVGGEVGLANRGVLVDTVLLTIVLVPEERTPLLKIDGRRGVNPARLLREETAIDGTKLLLENRRPGRPVVALKIGVGLIPLDGEPDDDDRKRKN